MYLSSFFAFALICCQVRPVIQLMELVMPTPSFAGIGCDETSCAKMQLVDRHTNVNAHHNFLFIIFYYRNVRENTTPFPFMKQLMMDSSVE
jgi:hypothetical protein